MAAMAEIVNAVLKGLGRRPTKYLFRWEPSFRNPFKISLFEVSKCETDGGIVTPTMPQYLRHLHGGHKIKDPKMYSWLEFLAIQLRAIR